MSEHDALERAFRLLREHSDGSSVAAGRSRLRILTRAREQARRRRRMVAALLPIAAVFLASLAWAALSGRLEHWLGVRARTSVPVAPGNGAVAEASAAPRLTAPPSSATALPDLAPSSEPLPAVAPEPPLPVRGQRGSAHALTSAHAGAPTPSASAIFKREQALYSVAHQAHFVDHDPAAAFSSWNAYLAEFPNGRFALEARYNRAISLVRLGRRSEAAAALEPFASGTLGGYRQHEARELLGALRDAGTD